MSIGDEKKVDLPAALDRLTDPDLDLVRVSGLVALEDGTLVVLLDEPEGGKLYVLKPRGKRLALLPGDLGDVEGLWPAGAGDVLVQSDGAIWRVELNGHRGKLLGLPEGVVGVQAAWHAGGLCLVALVDRNPKPDPEAPRVYPEVRKTIALCRYIPSVGWADLTEVPAGCKGLSMSGRGFRMAWIEPLNTVPEEARRGEVRGFDLDTGEVRAFTENAGKLDGIRVAPDGSGLIYLANHEVERPVTTHTDVWWTDWEREQRRNLTGGGQCVDAFGWLGGTERVWVTVVDGLDLKTEVISLDGVAEPLREGPASSEAVQMPDGSVVFETESCEAYPALWAGNRRVMLSSRTRYEDLRTVPVRWTAPDGTPVAGVVYEAENTPPDAPLLVRVHGGPAGDVTATRSPAVRHRHLLRAGYRVFNPAFRGSLGFGDAFLGANIGCQGGADLEDILSGIEYLGETGRADVDRVGIFGGSFGGYMTLRALAVTDRFRAGVAMFGFVSNRWMTLETGDFTYETEYIGPLVWPPNEETFRGDVFPHLEGIRAPLLLLHGDQDPICTLTQSKVVLHALERLDREVGLVVYPGEGHGFRKKANQRDSARRVLGWFLAHLPPG